LSRQASEPEEKRRKKFAKLLFQKLKEACAAHYQIVSDRRLLAPTVLCSVLIWLIEGLTASTVATALGSDAPLAPVILLALGMPATAGIGMGMRKISRITEKTSRS
jgi:uncharacterized membrane protein YbhN (UPF0104 family)